MSVITLPQSEKMLIQKAAQQDRKAQKALFDRFAARMLGVCRQYINDRQYAEDTMITGFTKAFNALSEFDTERNFEGWLRRIMINESISFLRKKKQMWAENIEECQIAFESTVESAFEQDEIQYYLDQLPAGYRSVFLLYAVEGYKHHEIADLLQISEGTSKSQLFKAREFLKEKLQPIKNQSYGR